MWDFSKEDYVDRLLQNQADGKLVQTDTQNTTVTQLFNKKIQSLSHEYGQMLAQTLESQRAHYEEQRKLQFQEHHNKIQECRRFIQ